MFDITWIEYAIVFALGALFGALIVTMCFWKGYSNVLKRIAKIEDQYGDCIDIEEAISDGC